MKLDEKLIGLKVYVVKTHQDVYEIENGVIVDIDKDFSYLAYYNSRNKKLSTLRKSDFKSNNLYFARDLWFFDKTQAERCCKTLEEKRIRESQTQRYMLEEIKENRFDSLKNIFDTETLSSHAKKTIEEWKNLNEKIKSCYVISKHIENKFFNNKFKAHVYVRTVNDTEKVITKIEIFFKNDFDDYTKISKIDSHYHFVDKVMLK